MNREAELINFLKQPVMQSLKSRAALIPTRIRWVHKAYGGRDRGRWVVFKASELPPHKGFSDALLATLAAKDLLLPFSRDSTRAFFLKECVLDYIPDGQPYVYETLKTIDTYKRL